MRVEATERVELFWQNEEGKPFGTLGKFRDAMVAQGRKPLVLMNAGIFEPGYRPTGLHVEEGEEKVPLNLEDAPGNFFLKPNGVFYVDKNGAAGVMEATAYTKSRVEARMAVQSGPMLLSTGRSHPKFNEGSPNRLIRNGVGVDAEGNIWFAATVRTQERFGNLWEFAALFRDELGCPDALFLDGDISELFVEPGPGKFGGSAFAGILAVFREEEDLPRRREGR